MALPLYLAMTASETFANPLPENMAYMACHFASYGLGISNIPATLPAGSMLILNDRIPVWQHDPALVARQLAEAAAELACGSVLLDFQRPGETVTEAIVKAIPEALSCPVGVSEYYGADLDCPVFLPPPPPDMPLERHLANWSDREVWLEVAPESLQITVTTTGSAAKGIPYTEPAEPYHTDNRLCCRYHIDLTQEQAVFTLSRTPDDLAVLLDRAQGLGVSKAVGLYQQFTQHKK